MPITAGSVHPNVARFYKTMIYANKIDVSELQSPDELAAAANRERDLRQIATQASSQQGISMHAFYRQVFDQIIKPENDTQESDKVWDAGIF